MAQRIRFDQPGAWLHVMNRGVARRTICEARSDYRFLLSAFARAARAGWFEIHAYSLLGTHFHLLLRSTLGECWRGLRRAQNAHARRFNITRHRDGSLFRGRFRSKRVWSAEYWWTVVRYIDANAVQARLAARVEDWPWSSAHHYIRGVGPPWLERSVVERVVTASGGHPFTPDGYLETFGHPAGEAERRLVEAGLDRPEVMDDSVRDLLGATSSRVRSWMRRKARLADGTQPGLPVVTPEGVVAELDACERGEVPASARDGALRAWLLRTACGCGYAEIGQRCGFSTSTAYGRVRAFRLRVLAGDPAVETAAAVLQAVVEREWPGTPRFSALRGIINAGSRDTDGMPRGERP